jgi:hypothetical protein
MDNLLSFPKETVVDRVVPKTMFYKFMEVNPRMKTRFVNDVVSITWLYKLSAATLNVTDTPEMKEVEVFVATLKQPDCPSDFFSFVDANMPHHIVFILLHDGNAMLLINYKDWADNTHTKFKITQAFTSPWVTVNDLSLKVEGQSLPRIYDNFVAQISGIGEHKAGAMADIVQLKQDIAKAESDLLALEKKMRKEPQLDRQMKMNKDVKAKRTEIENLKKKLEELK